MIMMRHELESLVWDTIIVIDSLSEQPGKELHDSKLQWIALQKGLGVGYANPCTKDEFFEELKEIKETVIEQGIRPILHFETHGSHEGLVLESGEVVSWSELCDYLRRINIAMRNSLLVVLGACYGVEISSQVHPLLEAPFRCVIAPIEKVSFGKMEEGFDAFYEAIPNGIVSAVQALNNHRDNHGFAYVDITTLFQIGWQRITSEYDTVTKMHQLADYLFEVKSIRSIRTKDEARQAVIDTLQGGEDSSWQAYRRFMLANTFPDAGQDSLCIIG